MAPVGLPMPDGSPGFKRLGDEGREWLRAEAALVSFDLRTLAVRWAAAAGLCLVAQAFLFVCLFQLSQVAVIGAVHFTGDSFTATVLVAIAALGLAALAAALGLKLIQATSPLSTIRRRLSAFWSDAVERTP